jgi:hypothetical protein
VSYVSRVVCPSPLLLWFFPRFSDFPPSRKITISEFQLDSVDEEPLCGNATVILIAYLYLYLFILFKVTFFIVHFVYLYVT